MAFLIEAWQTVGAHAMPIQDLPGRRRRGRIAQCSTVAVMLAVAALVLVGPNPSHADSDSDREYAVKAAYIYNFARFVDWPADAFPRPDAPFVIGIVGKDPFGSIIDHAVQGKSINGRPFVVRRLKLDQDLRQCHILFVSASEKDKIGRLLAAVGGAPILTVGETPGFACRGGIVNFRIERGTVRFEINPDTAKRVRLTISSRLLGLARIVKDEER